MHSKLLLAAVAALSLTGCASTYQKETLASSAEKLAAGASIVVATPPDASYTDEHYPGTGAATSSAVRAAFARFTDKVAVNSTCAELDCLRSQPAQYYVVPQILHWEERATEWSGKKDKLELKISIYGTDGKLLASQIISGKSKWATMGGDHVEDLLPEPLNEYVRSLY